MGIDALRRDFSVVSVSALSSPKMPLDKANAVINERGHLGVRVVATTSVVIVLAIQQLRH